MDPNAARQSPQQRKFDNHRSKIVILIRDQKAIVYHSDKNLNVVQRSSTNCKTLYKNISSSGISIFSAQNYIR
jgi:hypothetical protein